MLALWKICVQVELVTLQKIDKNKHMSQKLNFRLITTSIKSHVLTDTIRFPLCPLVEANPTSLYQKCFSLTNKDINFKAYLHVELCEQ